MNNFFMTMALEQAKTAREKGEVPIGAVLVHQEKIIAEAHNLVETQKDPLAHAEILLIRRGCQRISQTRLIDCDVYVTLEPCAMCAGALSHARVRRLYYGAYDGKAGAVDNGVCLYHTMGGALHKPDVYGGILETECGMLLSAFFSMRRL